VYILSRLIVVDWSEYPPLIVKLDFEKAFDKVEHQVILEVMKHKGFLAK
jgi:hypothetical protein